MFHLRPRRHDDDEDDDADDDVEDDAPDPPPTALLNGRLAPPMGLAPWDGDDTS